MIKRLNVVLRTCDRVSLRGDRIVPKDECIRHCLRSLVGSLETSQHPYALHIIDDASSDPMRQAIRDLAPMATYDWLEPRDQTGLDARQKSRHSVKVEYEHIDGLPEDELVYIVEDDYLHYDISIGSMLAAWYQFNTWFPDVSMGIFPQDFRQLYFHPLHPHNDIYLRPCQILPGPDRYYRTTWYTQESFMIPISVIRRYRSHFADLLTIGSEVHIWEGSTISHVWEQPDVMMLMPMHTLAVHLGTELDVSFHTNWQELWERWA